MQSNVQFCLEWTQTVQTGKYGAKGRMWSAREWVSRYYQWVCQDEEHLEGNIRNHEVQRENDKVWRVRIRFPFVFWYRYQENWNSFL